MKIVVYQVDKFSFFTGSEGGASVSATEEKEKPWLLDRLPIIPFVNKKDTYTDSGRSELRPAIPLQDVLNRTVHSAVMVTELSAFGIKWSKGMEISLDGIVPGGVVGLVLKDDSGVITNPTTEQIEFMKSVEVGQFEATDVTQYLEVIDKIVQQIGQVTQTPIRGVTSSGQISGEALKQLEIGLLGKVQRFQWQNTSSFSELLNLTAEIQNAYDTGQGAAPELGQIKVVWKDAEILDVNARITALKDLRMDSPGLFDDSFYIEQIGSLLSLSQSDVDEQKEAAKEQQGRDFRTLTGGDGGIPVV